MHALQQSRQTGTHTREHRGPRTQYMCTEKKWKHRKCKKKLMAAGLTSFCRKGKVTRLGNTVNPRWAPGVTQTYGQALPRKRKEKHTKRLKTMTLPTRKHPPGYTETGGQRLEGCRVTVTGSTCPPALATTAQPLSDLGGAGGQHPGVDGQGLSVFVGLHLVCPKMMCSRTQPLTGGGVQLRCC